MRDRERIAHEKKATVSDWLRSLFRPQKTSDTLKTNWIKPLPSVLYKSFFYATTLYPDLRARVYLSDDEDVVYPNAEEEERDDCVGGRVEQTEHRAQAVRQDHTFSS